MRFPSELHEEHWENFLGRFGWKAIEHYHLGGGPRYLEGPLFEGSDEFMQMVADSVLDTGGPRRGMRRVVDLLAGRSINRAPLRTGHLISTVQTEVEG